MNDEKVSVVYIWVNVFRLFPRLMHISLWPLYTVLSVVEMNCGENRQM